MFVTYLIWKRRLYIWLFGLITNWLVTNCIIKFTTATNPIRSFFFGFQAILNYLMESLHAPGIKKSSDLLQGGLINSSREIWGFIELIFLLVMQLWTYQTSFKKPKKTLKNIFGFNQLASELSFFFKFNGFPISIRVSNLKCFSLMNFSSNFVYK